MGISSMKGILTDGNAMGHVNILLYILLSEEWSEIWTSLNIPLRTFASLGLNRDAPDTEIWRICQKEELVLITNNRNDDVTDSLESTIRVHNTPASLPVFTFADSNKIVNSREYATRVVERMLEYLMDVDSYRGTGRLYLP